MSKVMLVTGGSRGIAAACARRAAESGYDVCISYLSRATEAELVASHCRSVGSLGPRAPLATFSVERVRRALEVNVLGAFMCAREAVRRMSTRQRGSGGSIVNISSTAAYLGSPNEFIDYAASKGAVDTLTIGLSKEVAADGIRVNAVRPGIIDTELHASSGQPDRVRALASTIPLGRGGRAEEVAALVLWLVSEEASYVTGSLVNCSGGR